VAAAEGALRAKLERIAMLTRVAETSADVAAWRARTAASGAAAARTLAPSLVIFTSAPAGCARTVTCTKAR
jgi:hypothetical protein